MEELSIANANIQKALSNITAEIIKLDEKETSLKERLDELNKEKLESAWADLNANDDDLVEVNAGGRVISAKRSTLTQPKGTRFEALFSGRWDKRLQRDGHGRIFLDVDPDCFQAIIDYLNELAISSEDSPPSPPDASDEHKHILRCQLELFGLWITETKIPESNIIKSLEEVERLHGWMEEDGSDGELRLLYRSSRDGPSASAFHSKCDNQGCTLTIIETRDGYIVGGYSNTPWEGGASYKEAGKAFLFVLSGSDISFPHKMKLKNANDGHAIAHSSLNGPVFGGNCDLSEYKSKLDLRFGHTYESGPPGKLSSSVRLPIKEMEVFQISGVSSRAVFATGAKQTSRQAPQAEPVSTFSEDIKEALIAKQKSLLQAELEITHLEDCLKDEEKFIPAFACGETKDVVTLNVSGTIMATKRATLQLFEDSVLAQQFDDTKWTEQGSDSKRRKGWTPDDVASWAENIEGIQEDVGGILKENGINGCELLALNMEGLRMMGIKRAGTLCLLLKEIKALGNGASLIEHSPHCFRKLLDYLRWKCLHSQGLAEEPTLPLVRDSQKSRFEKVVQYYFPGDSAKLILG